MQKGIKTIYPFFIRVKLHDSNDPTVEMQKGIKTHNRSDFLTLDRYDPTVEMQKGIKTNFVFVDIYFWSLRNDPTVEMQKGIKTLILQPQISHRREMTRP